jgi:hypothetical protein
MNNTLAAGVARSGGGRTGSVAAEVEWQRRWCGGLMLRRSGSGGPVRAAGGTAEGPAAA